MPNSTLLFSINSQSFTLQSYPNSLRLNPNYQTLALYVGLTTNFYNPIIAQKLKVVKPYSSK